MPISKKEFKEGCYFQHFQDGKNRRNAIYYDYKSDSNFRGYKYKVKTSVQNYSSKELFDILYNWVVNEIQPDYYVEYHYAYTDEKRFKVSIMG